MMLTCCMMLRCLMEPKAAPARKKATKSGKGKARAEPSAKQSEQDNLELAAKAAREALLAMASKVEIT